MTNQQRGHTLRRTLALLALGGLTLLGALTAGPAYATQPDFICEGFDSGKFDTVGDPATVTVQAPEGFLIDGYCVKAGTTKEWHDVTPAASEVTVDHSVKDSVSHYSLRYVALPTPTEEPTGDPEPTPVPTETTTVPPVVPPTEPPVIGEALAHTGLSAEKTAALVAAGLLTIALGAIAVFWRRISTWVDGVWFRGVVTA